jgi:hypothetical protein
MIIIVGEHKVKQVKRSLLVLMASIEASLAFMIEPDLASGYVILKQRAEGLLCKFHPAQVQLEISGAADERTVVIATHRIIKEYEAMQKDCGDLIDLYNEILRAWTQEDIEDPESRKKTPAIDTLDGELRLSGLGIEE